MRQAGATTWRQVLTTAAVLFLIASLGSAAACALWLRDLYEPQIAILGSGNRLSLFVAEGPARLVIASGDDTVAFENAFAEVRPLFARRIDLLLISGDGTTLLVPLAASQDAHVRSTFALGTLPDSPEATALGAINLFGSPRRIQLGPTMSVLLETAQTGDEGLAAWRATIERGSTRVVVLSSAESAALFPPVPDAALLATDGQDLAGAWDLSPALAIVANADSVSGPDLRGAFAATGQGPQWGYRVGPGDALRLRFVADALQLPADGAQITLLATPQIAP